MMTNRPDIPLVLVFHTSGRTPWSETFDGMSAYAREVGWKLMLIEEDVGARVSADRMIQFWQPVGCLVECGCDVKGHFMPELFAARPCVFMNTVVELSAEVASFQHDNRRIGELAARELIAQGLDRFAFLGFQDYRWSWERECGFRSFLASSGVACETLSIPTEGVSWNAYVWSRDFAQFLHRLPQPCGLFAANDLLAETALNVCQKNHIASPDGLSVIGVDNDVSSCESAIPTLTSIQVNFRRQGYSVAAYLDDLIAGRAVAERRLFDSFSVVRRQSTRRLAQRAKDIASALEFIRLNACTGISSRDALNGCAHSRRRAEPRFRACTGHSILDEINAVRLARAMELLLEPDRPIESIAAQCGFKSTAHLRVLFRRETGLSLRDWRKMHH